MENSQDQILDEALENGIDQPWIIAVKYGVIGGIIFIFFDLIRYSLGMMDVEQLTNPNTSSTITRMIAGVILSPLSWIAYFGFYFLAVKNYREELGGFISFGKSYKVSIFSVFIKAIFVFIWGMIYYFLIVPDYCQDMVNIVADSFSQNVGSGSDNVVSMYEMMYNPFSLTLINVLLTLGGGAFLSLIAAAIGQKAKVNN